VEDVAQETFLSAYQSLGSFKGTSPFENWLSAIAKRKCMDYWRKNHLQQAGKRKMDDKWMDMAQAVHAQEAFDGEVWRKEARGLLDYVLSRMEADERELLMSVYFEDMSMREAADLFGISVTNAKVRAHRARNKMRRLLHEVTEGDDR
jgi:RNA polymerase sigma-70 factor (ECF subfamily)